VLDENIFHSGTILPKAYGEILENRARDGLQRMARHARLMRAKKLKASMIVMGSHGRTGVSRLMLGSVAERTLRYAECPVLIVKK
jgi:nucleotide-binding universal stress UspA family protein